MSLVRRGSELSDSAAQTENVTQECSSGDAQAWKVAHDRLQQQLSDRNQVGTLKPLLVYFFYY